MRVFLVCCAWLVISTQINSQAEGVMPITALTWVGDQLFIARGELMNSSVAGEIAVYDLATGDETFFVDTPSAAVNLVWDGEVLYSTHLDSNYFFGWDGETGERVVSAPESGQGSGIDVIDGRLVVSYGGVLTLYDDLEITFEDAFYTTATGQHIFTYVVEWMADGAHLITSGHPDAPEFISLWSVETQSAVLIFDDSDLLTANGFDLHLALSADGRWLAGGTGWQYLLSYHLPSHEIFVWDTEDGSIVRTFATEDGVTALAWSPDGVLLASTQSEGTLTIRDVTTGETVNLETLTDEHFTALAWSSNGVLVAGTDAGRVLIYDAWQE